MYKRAIDWETGQNSIKVIRDSPKNRELTSCGTCNVTYIWTVQVAVYQMYMYMFQNMFQMYMYMYMYIQCITLLQSWSRSYHSAARFDHHCITFIGLIFLIGLSRCTARNLGRVGEELFLMASFRDTPCPMEECGNWLHGSMASSLVYNVAVYYHSIAHKCIQWLCRQWWSYTYRNRVQVLIERNSSSTLSCLVKNIFFP